MDIRINNEEGQFKFRVCGILQHNNKYLIQKINHSEFYCLPGGHVELNEDTNMAILREMKEELGFEVKIKKLISINQNFFKTENGKPFHELGFYYLIEAQDEKNLTLFDYERDELDKGELKHLEFKWIKKEEFDNIDFRPAFIIKCLENKELTIDITRD